MKLRNGWATALLAGLAALPLAGCGSSDTASFMLGDPDTALTLERNKSYFWSDEWDLQLVVRRFPDCQRRHDLKTASGNGFKMELFSPSPGVFIVKQGKRWYVTILQTCELQAYKEPPPEPGTPVGAFAEKDGVLGFTKAP